MKLRSILIDALLGVAIGLVLGFLILNSNQIQDDFINLDRPYVAKLTNFEGNSGGTGFYVKAPSGKTYVLTNAHVCGLADKQKQIVVNSTKDVYVKKVIEIYKEHDLCLIEAPEGAKGLTVASSVRDGENVSAIGHPLLQPYTQLRAQISGELDITILVGFDIPCAGTGFRKEDLDGFAKAIYGNYACLRTLPSVALNAEVLPGNSGSPVVNKYGQVVAVVYAGGSGRGYAVGLNYIKAFLENR